MYVFGEDKVWVKVCMYVCESEKYECVCGAFVCVCSVGQIIGNR